MKFFRADLLRTLEACSLGLSSKDNMEQSSCFVFRNGQVITYNGEICCTSPLTNAEGVPFDCYGAVPAKTLLQTLRKSPDDEIEIFCETDKIKLKGGSDRRKQQIPKMADIVLPIEEVETATEYVDLPPIFGEAIARVAPCAAKDSSTFALTCVAFGPKGIQATDCRQAIRFLVATGRKEGSVLVRAESLKGLDGLGLAAIAYGDSWVHFRTYAGVVVSVRLIAEPYPNIGSIFTEAAKASVSLPVSVADIIARAMPFVAEKAEGKQIEFTLSPGNLLVRADSGSGGFEEDRDIEYTGGTVLVKTNPEVLPNVLRYAAPIEVCDTMIRIKSDGCCYCVSAEVIYVND